MPMRVSIVVVLRDQGDQRPGRRARRPPTRRTSASRGGAAAGRRLLRRARRAAPTRPGPRGDDGMLGRWSRGTLQLPSPRGACVGAASCWRCSTPHEPRATPLIVDVAALGLAPWRQRAWVLERDGRTVAIVVLTRVAIDRWLARCVLIDAAAASAVAALVDASPAVAMAGAGPDVAPVHPHLAPGAPSWLGCRGWSSRPRRPGGRARRPTTTASAWPARRPTRQLRSLYRGYELAIGDTWWQERSAMRTLLRCRTVYVAEDGGRARRRSDGRRSDGPLRGDRPPDRAARPPAPGRRRWQLLAPVQRLVTARDVGVTAAIAADQPDGVPTTSCSTPEWWLTVTLSDRDSGSGASVGVRALAARIGAVRRRDAHLRAHDRPDGAPPLTVAHGPKTTNGGPAGPPFLDRWIEPRVSSCCRGPPPPPPPGQGNQPSRAPSTCSRLSTAGFS